MNKHFILLLFLTLMFKILTGCMPVTKTSGEPLDQGQLLEHLFVTEDGTALRVKKWLPVEQSSQAVIIALHGFNDYRQFFQQPAEFFAQNRIISYAYDQRGFGESPNRGFWAGIDTYVNDLALFISLIKSKHPGKPVFLLGESMGGAIIINTVAKSFHPEVDGIILAAPAVWGRKTMPWYQTSLLWSLSHSLPWLTLTGDNLEITASDNFDMLMALSQDPLVIKETRVDAIYGLVNLMDKALESSPLISVNALLLYGEKDEIIPLQATYHFLQDFLFSNRQNKTIAFYSEGYHMLLRDLQAPFIWQDILAWLHSFKTPLPSQADKRAIELITQHKQNSE